MNVLFLTLSNMISIKGHSIYIDLMRTFKNKGHNLYIVSPAERRTKQKTHLLQIDGIHILKVKTFNIKKTNFVEKGIGTLMIEAQFKRAIQNYLADVRFDLILYSTPPITFTKVIKYLKKKNPNSIRYLLLKDIFPQNAVDLGMFGKKSLLYWFFRKKEISLYKNSDFIGCMSPANVEFLHRQNPYYPFKNIEVAPNSIELINQEIEFDKNKTKAKFKLPLEKTIFIYGGNLGKPQGIDFLIKCLDENKDRKDCHFVIVGNGTEFQKINNWYQHHLEKNVTLLHGLPKNEYDQLVRACDVGLIFLDHRFTIPNYPSKLLNYLEYKMPVLCATDPNTDIGRLAKENGYGFWCESNNVQSFTSLVDKYTCHPDIIPVMGQKGYDFLCNNYLTKHTYQAIMRHFPQTYDKDSDMEISTI